MSIDPKDCSFLQVVAKATKFWRLCWNQTPLLKLPLKFSHTCELRISRIDTHSLFCNPGDKHREQRSRSWREFQLCVEKHNIYIVQINTLAFEGFWWSSLDFWIFQSFWRFGDHWAWISNVDSHMTSKVWMGNNTTGSNCIQWCERGKSLFPYFMEH